MLTIILLSFKFNKFYKQFAYGAGAGLRYDFSFFIIRLDLAIPIQDPGIVGNDKLFIKTAKIRDIRPNIGINYPF